MIAAIFLKYESHKDTGVEWLGEIPEGWKITRLKFLSKINPPLRIDSHEINNLASFLPMEYVQSDGSVEYSLQKPIKQLIGGFTNFKKSDVIVAKITPCFENGKGAYLDKMPTQYGFGSTEFHVIRANNKLNTAYAYYVTKSNLFMKVGENGMIGSAGQKRIQADFVKNFYVAHPNFQEQTLIAKFLDQKTAQIDQAIAIKERQIELLQERKQIIIQQAVTRGLDPSVPMKDSGVEWIGQIPEHWEIRRSKFVFSQRKEQARQNDIQLSATQAYGVISQEKYEELTGKRVVKIQFHLDKRKHVEVDDFVISMRSFQGGLERAWESGCIRSSYIILKAIDDICVDFYSYLFKLPSYIKALQQTARFIRNGQDLNFNNFSQVDLFIPPKEEQIEIAQYIEETLASSKAGIEVLSQQIQSLKEYKTTLINSAVTGKIKITPEMLEV